MGTQVGNHASPVIGGIRRENRESLQALHRAFQSPFSVAEAAEILGRDEAASRRLLAYLARQGWLARVRQGLYLTVPLDAARSGAWVEDPWIVAAKAFSPCFIGGWSAAEHWGLTDQVFRTVVVITARAMRRREHTLQGMPFVVSRRQEETFFGLRPVWRRNIKISVSDPSRTIIDVLDDPSIGGGIRHVALILQEYLSSDHRNDELLIEYGDRLGNRSVFKRLGWLLEVSGNEGRLLEACRARRSTGLAKLDPTVEASGKIVRRWGLRVNVALEERTDDW